MNNRFDNNNTPASAGSDNKRKSDFTPAYVGLAAAAGAAAFATGEAIVEGVTASAAELEEDLFTVVPVPEDIPDVHSGDNGLSAGPDTPVVEIEPVPVDPYDMEMPRLMPMPVEAFPDEPAVPEMPEVPEPVVPEPVVPEPENPAAENPDIPEALIAEDMIDPDDIEDEAVFNFSDLGTMYDEEGNEITYARLTDDDGNRLIAYDYDNDGRMDELRGEDGSDYVVVDSDGDRVDLARRIFVDDVEEALQDNDGYLAANQLNMPDEDIAHGLAMNAFDAFVDDSDITPIYGESMDDSLLDS